MRNTSLIFVLVCMTALFAGAVSAAISPDLSTILIKPDTNFTINDTAYLAIHIVSLGPTPTPFTVDIQLTGGITNISEIYFSDWTGNCKPGFCVYDASYGFLINGTGTFGFVANVTDNSTNGSIIIEGNSTSEEVDPPQPPTPPINGGGSSKGSSSSGGGAGGVLLSTSHNCLQGTVTVAPNDKIEFVYKGTNYTLFVKDIISNSIMFRLYPIPSREIQVASGQSTLIDLDWNNKNDFRISVTDTQSNVAAKVSCEIVSEGTADSEKKEEIKEESPLLTNIKEGILNIASEVLPRKKASPVVGLLLAILIIVLGLLGYIAFKRRKSRKDEFSF